MDVTNVETWNLDPDARPSGDEALRAAAKRVAAFPYQAKDPEGRYALADLRDVLSRAALAAPVSPSPDVLDVDRLARVMHRLRIATQWSTEVTERTWAEAIAREYAALRESGS